MAKFYGCKKGTADDKKGKWTDQLPKVLWEAETRATGLHLLSLCTRPKPLMVAAMADGEGWRGEGGGTMEGNQSSLLAARDLGARMKDTMGTKDTRRKSENKNNMLA